MIKTYMTTKQISAIPDHYVNVTRVLDSTTVTAGSDGKKILLAGTVVGGVGGATLADPTKKVQKSNDANAEGILFNNVDVTNGDAPVAVMIHGFVDLNKLPEVPTTAAISALKQITFLK